VPSSDLLERIDALEKQNEMDARSEEQLRQGLQATMQELQKFKNEAEAGRTPEGKLIRACPSRLNTIYWALKRASPSLPDEQAIGIASSIDSFEDFRREYQLHAVVIVMANCSSLHIHGSEQRLRVRNEMNSYHELPSDEQEHLKEAVDAVIRDQKRLFPVRSLVKEACSRHLEDFVPEPSWANASLAQIEEKQQAFYVRMHHVFRELEESKVDVEGVLLDSWKPLAMIRPLAAFGSLERARARLEGERESGDEPAMKIFRGWKTRWKRLSGALQRDTCPGNCSK